MPNKQENEAFLNTYLENLTIHIMSQVKKGQEYALVSGYHNHAIYVNFLKMGESIGVIIDNLGTFNEEHPQTLEKKFHSCQFIKFSYNSKKDLQDYLYDNFWAKHAQLSGKCATHKGWSYRDEGNQLSQQKLKALIYPQNCQKDNLQNAAYHGQTVGNCTVKNFNIGTLRRMNNPELVHALQIQEKLIATLLQEDTLELPATIKMSK